MDISAEKEEIIRRFNQVHDIGLIKAIKSLLDFGLAHQDEYDDQADPALKASIEKGINDADNGRVRPYDEFMAEIRKRNRA